VAINVVNNEVFSNQPRIVTGKKYEQQADFLAER